MSWPRNKKSNISTDVSPKYLISAGTYTILLTESRLVKKSIKSPIFRQNIINFRYFGEISRVYLTRTCVGIFGKISINIEDISVKYRNIEISARF